MEMLSIEELPLGDHHHRSSFLASLDVIEEYIESIFPYDIVSNTEYSILIQDTISEGNLGNIT
jgi:hypothetical protein